MADTDFNEWVLLDTDLTTRLAILPVLSSHLYLEFCEPGSGELRIPLDSTAAGLITSGMFCQCFYRGASRGGFFVDNLKEVQADSSENSGRILSVSGRGALALLEDAMIWDDGSGATTRLWTGATKASILIDMIDEAQGRGALANLTYDFSDTDDSASAAWTDSEDYKFNVGMSLLDLLREFAKTGTEFDINLTGGDFVLSAYQGGIGSNKSNTVFLRIGSNCLEVSDDYRGDDLVNVMRVKYKDGYITVSDATSITNYRRREKLLSLEQAQSGGTASTYAAAKLDGQKDPKRSISVRVYDGVPPYLFLDYIIGDTVTVDMMGTEVSYRVLGIQADFNSDGYSNVVLELNNILYENQLKVENDLDWLLNQWNTARDDNLLEVNQFAPWGTFVTGGDDLPNVIYEADGIIYCGGAFPGINGVLADNIISYNPATGFWSALGSGIPISTPGAYVRSIIKHGGFLFAVGDGNFYRFDGTDWVEQTGTAVRPFTTQAPTMLFTDGTDLYCAGNFYSSALGGYYGSVMIYAGSDEWAFEDGSFTVQSTAIAAVWFNGDLYKGNATDFYVSNGGSGWTAVFSSALPARQFVVIGSTLYILSNDYSTIYSWDGSASSPTVVFSGQVYTLTSNLSDLYFGDYINPHSKIYKLSGGYVSEVGGDIVTNVTGMVYYDEILYIGGEIVSAGGQSMGEYIIWTQSFSGLLNHVANSSSFDLAGAIHNAPAESLTDNDEFGFWEDVTQAIRKITWANIKSTLKTYLDTLYVALTGNQSVAGDKTFTGTLKAIPSVADDTAIYAETSGDAYGLDLEQYTVGTNQTSPTLYLYRETSGAGNITGAMIEGYQDATGAGTITGDFIRLDDNATSKFFEVDKDGNVATSGVFTPASMADASAPNNSIYYSTTQSKLVYKDGGGTVNNLY